MKDRSPRVVRVRLIVRGFSGRNVQREEWAGKCVEVKVWGCVKETTHSQTRKQLLIHSAISSGGQDYTDWARIQNEQKSCLLWTYKWKLKTHKTFAESKCGFFTALVMLNVAFLRPLTCFVTVPTNICNIWNNAFSHLISFHVSCDRQMLSPN